MTELKPCPFCGSEEILINDGALMRIKDEDDQIPMYHCCCQNCGAVTKLSFSKIAVIKSWNRRVEDGKAD